MNPVLLALSPFIVAMLTGGLKKLPAFGSLSDGGRKSAIRLMAAFLAFASAVLGGWVSGNGVDPASVQVFSDALVAFLGATGAFYFVKK